jgi:excisionase family DNA binding protein
MSIHEASALIGVSPATLRRWSAAGDVKAFTTPGGHRRFSRSAVLAMLPDDRPERPDLERLGETLQRMIRRYRMELRRASHQAAWIGDLDPSAREQLRDHGDRIAAALLAFLDGSRPEERRAALARAAASAGACGRIAAQAGLPMQATVAAFLAFRMPFFRELGSVARRRGLDATETTQLLQEATEAFDRLLEASVREHETAVRPGSDPRAPEASDR